jgi:pantoate--beta-alanine ligase
VITVTTRAELRREIDLTRNEDLRIGFVPTLGYLHEGHLSLVDRALAVADRVVVSVFVNPLQFGPGEDLANYPRDLERDVQLAGGRGVDLLFAPDTVEMFPSDPAVFVDAPGLSDRMCGEFRPGHFRGVLTIVARLFHLVRPDVAVFGQKDYQQLTLIRRMVRDLDIPVEIVAGPIVREADGLALSSRNVLLDAAERSQAVLLHAALMAAQAAFATGTRTAGDLIGVARATIARGSRIREQYVELVAPETLDPVTRARGGDVLAIAAHVGRTRLIDNHVLTETTI